MAEALMENDGYDHSILGESQVMMIQFGVGLLLFMTYYAVFLVIDRNHPSLPMIPHTTRGFVSKSLRTRTSEKVSTNSSKSVMNKKTNEETKKSSNKNSSKPIYLRKKRSKFVQNSLYIDCPQKIQSRNHHNKLKQRTNTKSLSPIIKGNTAKLKQKHNKLNKLKPKQPMIKSKSENGLKPKPKAKPKAKVKAKNENNNNKNNHIQRTKSENSLKPNKKRNKSKRNKKKRLNDLVLLTPHEIERATSTPSIASNTSSSTESISSSSKPIKKSKTCKDESMAMIKPKKHRNRDRSIAKKKNKNSNELIMKKDQKIKLKLKNNKKLTHISHKLKNIKNIKNNEDKPRATTPVSIPTTPVRPPLISMHSKHKHKEREMKRKKPPFAIKQKREKEKEQERKLKQEQEQIETEKKTEETETERECNTILRHEDDDDEKLDPSAPAYIPSSLYAQRPWSCNGASMDITSLLSLLSTNNKNKLPVVPENDDIECTSNASTATTSTNGYITTNVNVAPLPTTHNTKEHLHHNYVITPQQFQVPPSLQQIQRVVNTAPPHPSHFNNNYPHTTVTPQTQTQTHAQVPNASNYLFYQASEPTLSQTPTLLNVAQGVIPGVQAGLYWYHPQIDQSALLIPVVINHQS